MAECPCGKTLSKLNQSGLCRSCGCRRLTSDPEINERRMASQRKAVSHPDARRATSERVKAYFVDNPEAREQRRLEALKHFDRTLGSLNARQAALRPDVIAKRSQNYSARMREWCPPDRWQEYQDLIRRKGLKAADAKRMILGIPEAPKPVAEPLSRFERQMLAVKNGKPLIQVLPISRADPGYSLTGVSDIYGA